MSPQLNCHDPLSLAIHPTSTPNSPQKPFILACEVARRLMAAQKSGRIVNISSTAHYSYNGGGAALYAITKTAIARMTETLAMEWAAFNINVNCIAPGAFISEMVG
jgi:NAD(P)-dependent dehydrogenase (short-subunit alcohol dehydrogenase family)